MTTTPFELVTDMFLDKIQEDTDFFKYDKISDKETIEAVSYTHLTLPTNLVV